MTCKASDFGTADSNCCKAVQRCDSADEDKKKFKCKRPAILDNEAYCAGVECVSSDFGGINSKCCKGSGPDI